MMTDLDTAERPDEAHQEMPCMEVFDDFAALEHLASEWDEFVVEVSGDIYMTYDWCRTWWEHYGGGRDLRIFVFRRDGAITGLFPMFIDHVWLGVCRFHVGKTVGSDSTISLSRPAVGATGAQAMCESTIRHLFGAGRCDAVLFGPMPADSRPGSELRGAAKDIGGEILVAHDAASGPHTFFALPESFDDYVASLGKSTRKKYRNSRNRLTKAHEFEVQIERSPTESRNAMVEFADMHAVQWRSEGQPGHFGDWPGSLEFHTDMSARQASKDRLRMIRIMVSGHVVAMQYAYVIGNTCHWILPARSTSRDWEQFSIGTLNLVHAIEAAMQEGARIIDAGAGHYPYKLQYGGHEIPRSSLLLVRNQWGSRLTCWLFLRLGRLLNLCYYRIWFARIAPRLPFRRRPLWRSWIRTRV